MFWNGLWFSLGAVLGLCLLALLLALLPTILKLLLGSLPCILKGTLQFAVGVIVVLAIFFGSIIVFGRIVYELLPHNTAGFYATAILTIIFVAGLFGLAYLVDRRMDRLAEDTGQLRGWRLRLLSLFR
jgi:hypothetical protein